VFVCVGVRMNALVPCMHLCVPRLFAWVVVCSYLSGVCITVKTNKYTNTGMRKGEKLNNKSERTAVSLK
jgi:hypothetical protein